MQDKQKLKASSKLSASILEQAAELLAGRRYANPAFLSSAILLVTLVALLLIDANTLFIPAIVCMVAAMMLWYIGDKWREVCVDRLQKGGLNIWVFEHYPKYTLLLDDNGFTYSLNDVALSYAYSDIQKIRANDEIALIQLKKKAFCIITQKGCTNETYTQILDQLACKSNKKVIQ